jgi:hydrogenase maturation protease
MMDMVGDRPRTKIIGVIPEVVADTTLKMTPAVIKGSLVMEKTLMKHLGELGFTCKQISDIDIQSVADQSCVEER